MPSPHLSLIKSAQKLVDDLGELFAEIRAGNSAIWRAYATILRAAEGGPGGLDAAAKETLLDAIEGSAGRYLDRAMDLGMEHAERDAKIYGVPLRPDLPARRREVEHISNSVALQLDLAELVLERGGGEDEITGGKSRSGILDPLPIIGATLFFSTRLASVLYSNSMAQSVGREGFERQAVAVIDNATTETCLNVHGEFADEDGFHLFGTPRDADVMWEPPFHKGCRTSVAVIAKKYVQEEVTREMREAAIEQEKKPKPARGGRARPLVRVSGNRVQEWRAGEWHLVKQLKSNFEARQMAASLLNLARS